MARVLFAVLTVMFFWALVHSTGQAQPAGSRAMGQPDDGQLSSGVRLGESNLVRHVPSENHDGGHFYGTEELVGLVERVAGQVQARYPRRKLSVGELSAAEGGSLSGHRSHQSGLDVDIGFYFVDRRGRAVYPNELISVGRNGGLSRWNGQQVRFDDAANWELVRLLVTDPNDRVQFIFIADFLAERLIGVGRSQGVPDGVLQRARALMLQPDEHPHDNHFHVRLMCPPNDVPGCRNSGPNREEYAGEGAAMRVLGSGPTATVPVASGPAAAQRTWFLMPDPRDPR